MFHHISRSQARLRIFVALLALSAMTLTTALVDVAMTGVA